MPHAGIDPPVQSHAGSTFNIITSLLGTLEVSILTCFYTWTFENAYPVDNQVICIIQTMPSKRQDSMIQFNLNG